MQVTEGMSQRRVWLVQLLAVFVIAGSVFDIVRGKEHWPFSDYRLYASVERERSLTLTWLFGVPEGEPASEVSLLGNRYIYPFNFDRLMSVFRRMQWKPNYQQRLSAGLQDCLIRYERLRQVGRHQGPKRRAIRLYRLHWRLDPLARNAVRPEA